MSKATIQLRGVEVHNLKAIDLDLPHSQLIAICGVSGSGKTSLALDTLYAEGQRRYIESFSPYTRQFLQRLDKPAAKRIDGIPPAIAVTHKNASQSHRTTVGTATEAIDYLRLLFARAGEVFCTGCGHPVRKHSPDSASAILDRLPESTRYIVAFPREATDAIASDDHSSALAELKEDGFVRAVIGDRMVNLANGDASSLGQLADAGRFHVVVDRLTAGSTSLDRLRDSLETAFLKGDSQCDVFLQLPAESEWLHDNAFTQLESQQIDELLWHRIGFSSRLCCETCDTQFPDLEPRLFSFNSPLGACTECEGFGNVIEIDMDRVVPDSNKSIRDGAIAPWNTPAYAHELEELLALADDFNIPVDVPFHQLTPEQLTLIQQGIPQLEFGGLSGFFAWLDKRKYEMHIRVFLSRWRGYRTCTSCHGNRLRPEALVAKVGGRNIAELCQMKIADATKHLESLELSEWQQSVLKSGILDQVISRLRYLDHVGVGYLTLDRTLRTLSNGEAQRVALTSALGSSLVNMLYVLDEPSVGLHPRDIQFVVRAIQSLRDRENTVVLVEHDEAILRASDHLVEIGPGAGESGGRVTFQGTPAQMLGDGASLTGDYLAGRRGVALPERRRETARGWIRLTGARGNNLKGDDVEFPLGVLCLVTGVSGSGKSTLVQDTLYPAICGRKRKDGPHPLPFDDIFGDGQIEDVLLIDQSPIGRSPRSNPVTYIKAFDAIRGVFAETLQARTHNYKASHFSFNVDGGRCNACKGDGYIEVDMQFLADVFMTCGQCRGKRYRREILDVKYRGKSIADVLDMTVRQAFSFFRGQKKVQEKLKRLVDVGLDYLRLGQPANTLSAGESQRLKLASYLNSARRSRTLFLMDEPTTGLHFADVLQLLDCFDALLNVGHSMIVVEHNLQLMKAADYLVDLGPGAADEGGRVVATGSPEEIAHHQKSHTGKFLRQAMAASLSE